jgi:hypothetical protein
MNITKVLLRILAWRFYRENSGLLLFSYVSVISYCFFIKTAGVYQSNDSVFYHLMLVMTFIISPTIMLLVFILYFIYTLKSWKYVAGQLKQENNQFLFYSFNACNKAAQFLSLFYVQLTISLPLIGYWLFATILGVLFNANVIPLITLIYILFLSAFSAFLYRYWLNKIKTPNRQSLFGGLCMHWRKPYSLLFLYYLSRRLKLSLLLTKVCSWLIIIGIYQGFSDDDSKSKIPGMIILSIVMVHSFLVYKDQYFKEIYLNFSRNMPYKRLSVLLNFGLVFLVIISPELFWLGTTFNLTAGAKSLVLGLTTTLLFRSLIYLTGLEIYKYLVWTFCLFVLQFYMLLFDQLWLLLIVNLSVALVIFYTRYYKPRDIISRS